jgi:HlyD family secretion protein
MTEWVDMDRELPPEEIRKTRLRKYSKVAVLFLLLIIAFFTVRSVIKPTISREDIRTAIAELGKIEATVSASGTVVPEFEQVLTSPIQSKIDSVFINTGESVKKGESILLLDKEFICIEHAKLEDELELQKNEKDQLRLELQQSQVELQTQFEIKELQVQFIESQLERERQLFEIGASNKTNIEQAKLNLQIAQREFALLASQIDNQQASLEADLRGVDIQIRIQEARLAETRRQIELAEARADRDGIVTWVNDDIGATVNPGDVIARIADLGSFKLEARISDIHAEKLAVNGPVTVRANDRRLRGRISNIRPSVQGGVMTFVVELENKSDEWLRPNLRADVFVVTSSKDGVIRVADGPFYSGLIDQYVFVVESGGAVRKTVDIGESNFDYVEILGDIEAGDEVIISDMSDYHHMKEIDIEDE